MGAKLSTSVRDLLISFDNKGLCKNPVQTTLATQITRKDTLVVESSVYISFANGTNTILHQ